METRGVAETTIPRRAFREQNEHTAYAEGKKNASKTNAHNPLKQIHRHGHQHTKMLI